LGFKISKIPKTDFKTRPKLAVLVEGAKEISNSTRSVPLVKRITADFAPFNCLIQKEFLRKKS
jgi:hypothetical protein